MSKPSEGEAMSARPWVVRFDDADLAIEVYNIKTHDVLSVWAAGCTIEASRKLAHRIADRLNATEGDER